MKNSDYLLILRRLLFAFAFYPLSRLLFLGYNYSYFSNCSSLEIAKAFFYGLRFDFSTMLIANLIFILLSIIPFRFKFSDFILKSAFCFFNTIFLSINIVDAGFFPFIGKKMTFDVFDMAGDITDQAPQLIMNYWPLALLILIFSHLLFHNGPKIKPTITYVKKIKMRKSLLFSFLIFLFAGIGIRGGVQLRSLSPKNAFIFEKFELGNLSVNAAYTMVRSIGKKGVPRINFYKTDQEAVEIIKFDRDLSQSEMINTNHNIVVIILESFSKEYMDAGYTPFLNSLKEKSLFIERAFANGRRSIEVLPSIFAGIPSLAAKPLYQSQYQTNEFYTLPQILKKEGYQTSFFHGGKKGTMDFDAYCNSIGVDRYYSRDDYPNSSHYDGNWGVFDHHYLDFFANEVNKMKTPFMASIFTLSSHQPYTIPKEFVGKFNKGNLPIHETIGYVDFALSKFFELVKDKPWFKETLFVITADHTQKLKTKKYNNMIGKYRVPLFFYHPGINLKSYQNTERIAQHVDVYPSILDFLGLKNKKSLLYGSSVFSKDQGRMINKIGNDSYGFIKWPYFTRMTGNKLQTFLLNDDLMISESVDSSSTEDELRAFIQYTNNGLKDNSLYKLNENK